MEEITITKYQAFDGTTFDDSEECLEYENSRYNKLAKERGLILLDEQQHQDTIEHFETCIYMYIPNSQAAEMVDELNTMFDVNSPFSSVGNAYNEDFSISDSRRFGWWMWDNDANTWRNLELEMKRLRSLINELADLT